MKKNHVLIVFFLAVVISVCMNVKIDTKTDSAIGFTLMNIEALADAADETTQCPDYNYVPDHFIEAKAGKISAQCTMAGQITVSDSTITGSFTFGQSYMVNIETKNCTGHQKGACCDQRQVGVHLLSVA
jgi:hypothetical protein